MKILLINKYLYPRGGAENYVFRLGAQLEAMGHQVQYFGMDHPDRVVGNRVNAYPAWVELRELSGVRKAAQGLRSIYSRESRTKLRDVLCDFQPEICHLNNFHYHLTPSILLEIRRWSRRSGRHITIVATAHDYQLVCPNHMCRDLNTGENCTKCLGGNFLHCAMKKCIHSSLPMSLTGTLEALLWHRSGVYRHLDKIICCSGFLKEKLDFSPTFAGKTLVMHNFVTHNPAKPVNKKAYVLYFGRFSEDKGITTLLRAAGNLPDIPFVFAGEGPLTPILRDLPNVVNIGFQQGEVLEMWIREAKFTVYPSECYENCPLSVMESIALGTPVLGADIGGIPELIRPGSTGDLFESGNLEDLMEKIQLMWKNPPVWNREVPEFPTPQDYCQQLLKIYKEKNLASENCHP